MDRRRTTIAVALGALGALVLITSCGGHDDAAPAAATAIPTSAAAARDRCLVRLHGKGGSGAPTTTVGDVTVVAPTGNADGWGARQWLYFPDSEYDAARAVVADSVTGCRHIILDGFSNGGSFAAALYCRGETFEGRLLRVVVDDPVTDHAVDGCAPSPSVAVTLYSTGALDAQAAAGWQCAQSDWTCEGGETIGITAYAAALGAPVQRSPFQDHQPYQDAPELSDWAPLSY
jgi:hypothetical protein